MIIVGSSALEKFNLNIRPVKDLDIWLSENEVYDNKDNNHVDSHIIPDSILDIIPFIAIDDIKYATPDAIYTIKLSHFQWDIFWEKTKKDILTLKHNGCVFIPELYEELKKHWLNVHGNKDFLSLKKQKKDFFNDFVYYQYDHDFLHELVSYPNKPVYTKCLKDNEDVLIDKHKFDLLAFDNKVRMFREEITVIACERWLLNPKNKENISWYKAYQLSLKKTITTLTKNWASDFLIFNIELFVKPDYTYFKHILETLDKENQMPVDTKIFKELLSEIDTTNEIVCLDLLLSTLSRNLTYELIEKLTDGKFNNSKVLSKTIADILGQYEYKLIQKNGGGEGGSEYCTSVFQLKDKLYKTEYSYYSYHGYDFDDISSTLTEVKPALKTITVYEPI